MINWIKHNKLSTLLFLIILYLIFRYFFVPTFQTGSSSSLNMALDQGSRPFAVTSSGAGKMALPNIYPQEDYAPQPGVSNRMVIQESNLSLLVADVVETRNKILEFTKAKGGYMVTATTQNPQDSPTATVVIRIPADKLQESLDYFHSLSIKVVSENLLGNDVTDQYLDIETRISQISRTMSQLEAILDQAVEISDITSLTQQILSYQNQIDSLKGQQVALEKNSQLARLTVYLSTDEIALPYAPSETFRPAVIFKLAVRSMVGNLRNLASIGIWVLVYSVIWIPALAILIFARKWFSKRKQ